jgi:hypothetical protein
MKTPTNQVESALICNQHKSFSFITLNSFKSLHFLSVRVNLSAERQLTKQAGAKKMNEKTNINKIQKQSK